MPPSMASLFYLMWFLQHIDFIDSATLPATHPPYWKELK